MTTKAKKPKVKKPQQPPRAIVPPRLRPFVGRPVASSTTQRAKRRTARGTKSGTLTASSNGSEGELMLFGTIGADFWGDGITAKDFNESLTRLGNVDTIRLRINSGGGDVFEATAIYNMLVKFDAHVIVEIEGVAASAATLISMAGDEVRISENAHFMIHRASGLAYGNGDELRDYLKLLDNADALIRLTYSKRTGISDSELVGMMDHDNWMTAQEACDAGFVDTVDSAKTVEPHITQASNATPARPVQLTNDQLAAWAESLNVLRVAACVPNTGDSPQSVSPSPKKEPKKMNAKLRAKCVAAGMDASLSDEAADKWLEDNIDKVFPENKIGGDVDDKITAAVKQAQKAEAEARKNFIQEVKATLELAFGENIPAGLEADCLTCDTIDAVRTKVMESKNTASDNDVAVIRFSKSQPRDRHISAIKAGVQVRALGGLAEKVLPTKDRPKDWDNFVNMPLIKIAEQCLLADGFSYDQVNRLAAPQVAMAALGFHRNAGVRADAGLHTTGSLLEVTRDAMNKNLTTGYEEAPQTWRGPMRQGSSVPDFKKKYVVKLSSVGNLPVWIDGRPPEEVKLANEAESYAVEARAEKLSFSWKLFVNDDMDALSRAPLLLGAAAGRTVNAVAWNQVTSNPTMADGQALFLASPTGNRKRSNLTTGSATPTNTTLAAMRTKMRLMRGLNTPEGAESQDILNLTPTYLVAGATLEGVITQQWGSTADPASGGNAGILNLVKYWGLIPVIEPLLDAASTTAWYLFAAPTMIDTVEVTFLQGQETPVTHEWMDDETMSQNFTIVQTFAAKAIDHRGMQKHDGA